MSNHRTILSRAPKGEGATIIREGGVGASAPKREASGKPDGDMI